MFSHGASCDPGHAALYTSPALRNRLLRYTDLGYQIGQFGQITSPSQASVYSSGI